MPKDLEKRREDALEYLVRKFYESKMREAKLKSYGIVRRRIYKIGRGLRDAGMIFREAIVKPVGIATFVISCFLTLELAVLVSPKIVKFIDSLVPFPYNVIINIIVTLPIPFSPLIIGEGLYLYHIKKELEKRLKEEYGIEA